MDAEESNELPEGTRLMDRYVIIDRIAGGGMASIYRATDERLDRVVCVKLLRGIVEGSGSTGGGSAYEASYAHFLQEALALSRLSHPNTLKIYDFGYLEQTGRPFQISEFLDGGTLEQYVRAAGAIPGPDVLAILKPIVGALVEAHAAGIIHRDIKPSNILFARVSDRLIPKLADFGIARSHVKKRGRDDEDQISNVTLFSPRWAAPEQLAAGAQDERTDVYALALVAANMLSGRTMFDGKDVRNTFGDRIMGDALVSRKLSELKLGGAVAQALLRGLAASPQRRTAGAMAFFDDLKSAVRDTGPVRPRMPSISTITLDTDKPTVDELLAAVQEVAVGAWSAKIVEVRERLDMSFPGPHGEMVNLRLTMVPGRGQTFRLNIKGLNCFVAPTGPHRPFARPSPAVVADHDGEAELWTVRKEPLGRLGYVFGTATPGRGRVFLIRGQELVIPSNRATLSIALIVGTEVVVMCSKPWDGRGP